MNGRYWPSGFEFVCLLFRTGLRIFFFAICFFFHRWIAWFVLSIAFNWMPFYIHWELFIRDLNSYRNVVYAFFLIPLVWFGFVLMFPRLFMHYNRITGRRLAWRIVIVAKRRELIVLNTGLVWCCCCCCFFFWELAIAVPVRDFDMSKREYSGNTSKKP